MPKRDGFDHGVPSWVDLTTTDVEAAKNFYASLFGWQWEAADVPPDLGAYWMARLDGELVAGLSPQPEEMAGQGIPSTWNTYINVESVDETTARAEAAGAQVVALPMDIGDAGRMAVVRDPSGAAIGMWQAGTHRGAGLVAEPGALTWNEVYAPDTGAIVSFYKQVFGWESASMSTPDGGGYTTFSVGGAPVGGTVPPTPEQMPPHWQVWFGSADSEATAARAAELGATVFARLPGSPPGNFAFLRDPTGATLAVITPPRS
jgi:uncharacterized protein